ncbi:hypothetical protein [Catalinimonas niigatensis]|uniref:hypothetical protein n=1 Tax=Catalinimonas niigatensis TaxID=1397264 RepID=UPI0026662978|nr:hypothetical protein [Catalinimonas niigatensis]WPP50240.1 hypothetical protein PZB72_26600 [Catalinimonas niigatensis]
MIQVSIMTVFILSSLTACEDEDTGSENEETQSEQAISDEALADDLFEDMDEISMEAATYEENARMEGSVLNSLNCVSRTIERENPNSLSKRVTLTFSDGCEDASGRVRSGSIIVNHSIDFTSATYSVSTTFEDFYVNGHQIEGTRSLVYASDGKNLISATITLTNGKISLTDGSTITRNGSFTKMINHELGEVSLSGSASGVNRNGISYISEITRPLVYKVACASDGIFMASSGNKSISRAGRKTLELDYGDGICDRSLTLSADGVERTLEITINK